MSTWIVGKKPNGKYQFTPIMRKYLLAVALSCLVAMPALAQGPLNPPGAPAPTMKTLQDIYDALEKRAPIPGVPFTITNDGVYYLEKNLVCSGAGVSGITIGSAVKVAVVDLRGFSIVGAVGTSHGVNVTGSNANVRIANGQIMGFGGNGVNAGNVLVNSENITVKNCGGIGAVCGKMSRVYDSVFQFNATRGCVVGEKSWCSRVRAEDNGGDGLCVDGPNTVVADTSCNGNVGVGLRLGDGGWCFRVRCNDNTSDGARFGKGCKTEGLRSTSNGGAGLVCGDDSSSIDTDCSGNTSDGVKCSRGNVFTSGICNGNTGRGISAGSNFKLTDFSVANNLGGGVLLDGSPSLDPNNGCGDEVASCNIFNNLQFGLMITNASGNDSGDAASVAIRNVTLRNNVAEIINHAKSSLRARDVDVRGSINFTLGANCSIHGSFFMSTATNCDVTPMACDSGIIEESEFIGKALYAYSNSIIRRCVFANMCSASALSVEANCLVESCTFRNIDDPNGFGGNGVKLGPNSIVRNCVVMDCARHGIDLRERGQVLILRAVQFITCVLGNN
jgi:hypothetical protein